MPVLLEARPLFERLGLERLADDRKLVIVCSFGYLYLNFMSQAGQQLLPKTFFYESRETREYVGLQQAVQSVVQFAFFLVFQSAYRNP